MEDIGYQGKLIEPSLNYKNYTINVYERGVRSFCYACFDQNGKYVSGGTTGIWFTKEEAIERAKNFIDGIPDKTFD